MTALPDILAGLFIYTSVVVGLGTGRCGLAAGLALAIMMLPVIARSAYVVLQVVPGGLREASLALGASRLQTVWRVVLPTARPGLATAVILGVARGIGETAPVLLTSGATSFFNTDPLRNPMNSLPLYVLTSVRSGEPLRHHAGLRRVRAPPRDGSRPVRRHPPPGPAEGEPVKARHSSDGRFPVASRRHGRYLTLAALGVTVALAGAAAPRAAGAAPQRVERPSTSAATTTPPTAQVNGSGSSWAANAINQWVADVHQRGLTVTYNPDGSAAGRQDFAYGTSDLADSDIGYQGKDPLTGATDYSTRPYAYIPVVAGGTSFSLSAAGRRPDGQQSSALGPDARHDLHQRDHELG